MAATTGSDNDAARLAAWRALWRLLLSPSSDKTPAQDDDNAEGVAA